MKDITATTAAVMPKSSTDHAEATGKRRYSATNPMTIEERMALRARAAEVSDAEWRANRKAMEAAQAERIRTEAMGERFRNRTFSTFNLDGRNQSVREAYDLCLGYADGAAKAIETTGKFKGERVSLLLHGGVGTGKTHLAAAIANVFLDVGKPVCFATFKGHLDALQAEFGTESKGYFDRMVKAPLLVIDDITEYSDSKWTQITLLEAINARYEDLLPTIVTTNLSLSSLRDYNFRLYDRLEEMAVKISLEDASYRSIIGR